jgi:hypothetical protein
VRFLLAFLFWATLAFVVCWRVQAPYERWVGETGARLAAPPGATIEVVDMELFFPFDLGVYVALCLASAWAAWRRRLVLAAAGLPVLVALEIAALVVSFRVLMAAGGGGEAARLVNGLFRVEGLVAAAMVWLLALGRRHPALAEWAGAAGTRGAARGHDRGGGPRPAGAGGRRARRRGAKHVSVLLFTLAALPCGHVSAIAHGLGSSEMRLVVEGARASGEWEIHLRDARLMLGLDPDADGEPALAEVRAREGALRDSLTRRLALQADGRPCALAVTDAPMEWKSESSHLMFRLAADCPAEPVRLRMDCDLMAGLDRAHRAYFSVQDSRVTHVGVFREGQRSVSLDIHQFHALAAAREFFVEGARHIWTDFDHMLFLIALLLSAPLLRTGADWSPRTGFWPTTREVTKVVTAFTLAHSLTLALSFFGVVRLSSHWVELAIAASVFVAAWNNIRPFLPGRAWIVAFAFGLVHGMGFAGALGNLSLPRQAHGLALGTFNAGVEAGQLAIVAVALPLLYFASRRRVYPRAIMGLGSLGIAWMAVLWMLERGFGLTFFAAS